MLEEAAFNRCAFFFTFQIQFSETGYSQIWNEKSNVKKLVCHCFAYPTFLPHGANCIAHSHHYTVFDHFETIASIPIPELHVVYAVQTVRNIWNASIREWKQQQKKKSRAQCILHLCFSLWTVCCVIFAFQQGCNWGRSSAKWYSLSIADTTA